jgi:WD40 repeat protein
MSNSLSADDGPSTAGPDELDRCVVAFQGALNRGQRPPLDDFLPAASVPAVLIELVHVELEFRLKQGEAAQVEEYLARYPRLAEAPTVVADLVIAEYKFHQRRDRGLDWESYVRRFPACRDVLAGRFLELNVTTGLNQIDPLPDAASADEAVTVAVGVSGRGSAVADYPCVPGYELLSELGRGGMGVVYQARQTALGRTVALKMVLHADHAGADARARFRTEAEAVARLQHPHIVQVFEVGEHNGLPYFSLEYCPGGSLADRLDGTPWEAKTAARLVETLAHAMQAAHQAKVVHRDLKPANVLLAADGQAKITDFGLAKKLDEQGQTQSGSVLGTPSYMAPEQAGGKVHEIGPATDVYALGAILYELLTGRPPFRGATLLDTLRQVQDIEPVPPRRMQPRTPRDLETICLKCLYKEPHKRYSSAEALAEDLRRFQTGEPVQARPVGWPERTIRWTRRHPAVAILFVAIFLIVLAVPLALLGHSMQLQEHALQLQDALQREQQEREYARRAERVAQLNEAEARVSNFAADLHLAHNLFKAGDVFQLPGLLDPYQREDVSADDPRGFAWWYLRRHSQEARPGLAAHDGPVHLLRYSPDGRSLITSGGNRDTLALKVWDRRSGHLRFSRSLDIRTSPLAHAAYAPGGALLAGITERSVVTLWDARSGEQRLRLPQKGDAYNVVLSPDGHWLVVGDTVWDCATGRQTVVLPIPPVFAHLAFTEDSKVLAAWGEYPSFVGIRWWDVKSGHSLGQTDPHRNLSFLAYSPRGRFLVLAYHDPGGEIWDAASRVPLHWTHRIGPCRCLAVSPDERMLAAGDSDGLVRLYDIATGRLRGRYRWQGNPIVRLAFSPDNRTLAAATAEGQVRELDATVEHFPDRLQTIAATGPARWSPDGQTVAVAAVGGTVHLFDSRTGSERQLLRCPVENVRCLAFAPDGRTLATSCYGERIVRLWDMTDGRLRATTAADVSEAAALAFSPDGRRLAAVVGKRVRFWDAASGQALDTLESEQPIEDISFTSDGRSLLTAGGALEAWDVSGSGSLPRKPASSGWVNSTVLRLAVSRDGRRVATGQGDGIVRLWRLSADRKLIADGAELPLTREGSVTSLGFGPDNRTLLVVTPRTARLCDVSTRGRNEDKLTGALSQGALSPNGRTLAIVEDGGIVRFWDLASWRVQRPSGQALNRVASLVFSADGRSLVTAGPIPFLRIQNRKLIAAETAPLRNTTDSLRFWDATTGRETPSPVPGRETMTVPHVVARSPDGRLLAAGAEDGSISLWDWSKGQWLTRLFVSEKARLYAETSELARRVWTNSRPDYAVNGEAVHALAFSADGRGLAASGNRGSFRVWDTDGWKVCGQWLGRPDGSPWVTFTPDSGGVVGSRGGQVCVWNARSGEVQATLGVETDSPVLCGVFAPGKEVLALGSKDGAIRLWESRGGSGVKRLPGGHQDRVTSLAFAPDGRTLASGSWDRTVRLWNMAASREVAALEGHKGRVHALAFSPDGAVLASGGDGEVLFWRR